MTVSPHLTLVYPNTAQEKLKCQAIANAMNRQVSMFEYFVGTKRASIDTTHDPTISVTLRFDSEEERLTFLSKQHRDLPAGLANLRKHLSPLDATQESLDGTTSSPTRGLQASIKTIHLAPLGEFQACIKGNHLPPPNRRCNNKRCKNSKNKSAATS